MPAPVLLSLEPVLFQSGCFGAKKGFLSPSCFFWLPSPEQPGRFSFFYCAFGKYLRSRKGHLHRRERAPSRGLVSNGLPVLATMSGGDLEAAVPRSRARPQIKTSSRRRRSGALQGIGQQWPSGPGNDDRWRLGGPRSPPRRSVIALFASRPEARLIGSMGFPLVLTKKSVFRCPLPQSKAPAARLAMNWIRSSLI
jgi:hypothetical protein